MALEVESSPKSVARSTPIATGSGAEELLVVYADDVLIEKLPTIKMTFASGNGTGKVLSGFVGVDGGRGNRVGHSKCGGWFSSSYVFVQLVAPRPWSVCLLWSFDPCLWTLHDSVVSLMARSLLVMVACEVGLENR